MVYLYRLKKGLLIKKVWKTAAVSMDDVLWIDAFMPTTEEKLFLEKNFNIELPTAEEIADIEISRRLIYRNYTYYLTVNVIGKSESESHHIGSIAFHLTTYNLITVRYFQPYAFEVFENNMLKLPKGEITGDNLFINLLKTAIYHVADTLEKVGNSMDLQTKLIFGQHNTHHYRNGLDLSRMLQKIGTAGDITSKSVESLVSFYRMISYLIQNATMRFTDEHHMIFITLSKDITALREHSSFLANKVNFLLDATLGMINIQQSSVIKILSVAAVIFLPPTLIASIYGMNFRFLPELEWKYGYFISLGLMIISAWLPYKYFKRKNWL